MRKRKHFKLENDKHSGHAANEEFSVMEENRLKNLSNNQLLVKSDEKWFNQLPKNANKKHPQAPELIHKLKIEAEALLREDIKNYDKSQGKKRDKDFLWTKRILQSGTLSDKISAYTLLIQNAPVYNLHNVELLVDMISTKGKREYMMAVGALQELFTSELLAEERKLKPFSEQPLDEIDRYSDSDAMIRKRLLILWLFEDKLKALYFKFLRNVEAVSHDTVEKTKHKAVTVMYNLLNENPEQEQFLLEHIVNKIGDPLPKIGSHVCYLLGQLIDHHPNMNIIVMQEVERLLFRPNASERMKYYCLCFLNQIILSRDDYELANRLINVYFGQFRVCIGKGEVNTKMMSALLTGVSRAYPYAQLKDNVLMEKLDAMYRLVHMVNFNISIQALMLIFQVLDSSDSISDRFYSTLYRKLSDPELGKSSRQNALLNLIYRALKTDVSSVRVKSFVKRLLQVALYQAPNLQCGILILISEVANIHSDLLETKYANPFYDSDSDEHYEDIPDEDEIKVEFEDKKNVKQNLNKKHANQQKSWIHRPKCEKKPKTSYDPDARNPMYSGAEFSHPWELLCLKRSFHPSVSLFARQICNSKPINYKGDPLLDFTTAKFLDRFVFRNPKVLPESFKTDLHKKVFGIRKLKALDTNTIAITNNEYLQQRLENVPLEERFIYDYLKQRASSQSKKKKEDDSDIESICSDDFESLLDKLNPEDEEKGTLNFTKEMLLHKQKKSSKKKKVESDSEEEDAAALESLESESDFEDKLDFEGEDFQNAFGDFDEELKDMDENELCEEDFIDDVGDEATSSFEPQRKKFKKNKKFDNNSIFASADEFSTLLEDNAGDQLDTITVNALSNTDKSAAKQIAWEKQRHHFVTGKNWKKKFKKKIKFARKR